MTFSDPRLARPLALAKAALAAPPGWRRRGVALGMGTLTHSLFALGVGAMVVQMALGMTWTFGAVPYPWALVVNGLLLLQFPLAHSFFLTRRGGKILSRLIPGEHGGTLATTTYALIASIQLLALFTLWTPSGVVWWRAEGSALWAICAAYAGAWLFLGKAIFDGGIELQSGALGWLSLLGQRKPVFPDMPTRGTFAHMRQPIYVAFALTLWTVPIWTPDQLAVALAYTAYCLAAPRLKERRFARLYGARWTRYRARVPYMLPTIRPKDEDGPDAQ